MADGNHPAAPTPSAAQSSDGGAVEDAPTGTALTAAVAGIWSDLLKVPREDIDPGSHFFRLGGYSLLALQIVDRLKSDLALEVDIALVLGNPVLSDFVAALPAEEADDGFEEGDL